MRPTPVLDAVREFAKAVYENTGETVTAITLSRGAWHRVADELSEALRYEESGPYKGQPEIVIEGRLRILCDELLHWNRWSDPDRSKADGT